MFPTQFANPQGYFYPPPQHHGSQPAQHHGQTLGVIPIMYNLEGTNPNQVQDFQQQSNIVMMPPSGQQYRFQPPPQPQFVYVQSPQQTASAIPGTPIPTPHTPVGVQQQTVPVTPSTSVEKDSVTTTPSTDSKSPVNMGSSRNKKKSHEKSGSNFDKDNIENNEKTPVKENSGKSKDNSESPLATKLPQEEDVMYLKIDKALLSRPDIAKLLLESENPDEQANTSVNAGLLNTSTSSASKDIFIPPQQPTGLAAPAPPMQSQTAPIAPVMPVQYQQGYFMQSAPQSANLQSLPSIPFVSEEQEVVTFTTGQRLVMAFCVKCFDFQILHEVAE